MLRDPGRHGCEALMSPLPKKSPSHTPRQAKIKSAQAAETADNRQNNEHAASILWPHRIEAGGKPQNPMSETIRRPLTASRVTGKDRRKVARSAKQTTFQERPVVMRYVSSCGI